MSAQDAAASAHLTPHAPFGPRGLLASTLPSPAVSPEPARGPEIVQHRPGKSAGRGLWIGLVITLFLVLGGALVWQQTRIAPRRAVASSGIRTAAIRSGALERTVRITGTTAAAKYVSLVTPHLHGSRSDHGRDSSSSASGASSSSSSASSSAGSNASSSVVTSAPNASSAFTAATSRLGNTATRGSVNRSSTTSSTSNAGSKTSAAMGSSGLGSTADSIPGGGGGGGQDFSLVLQEVAPAGSLVHKGDQVAEFDRQYMLLRLDDYKASVFQGEASLKKRKADLEISHKAHEQLVNAAKGTLDKASLDLKTVPVLSDIDAAKARLAFEQGDARYKQLLKETPFVLASEQADTRIAELDLAEEQLELRRAQTNADRMIFTAPIDGLVVMQSTFRGAEFGQIQQGDQLWPGRFFMQIVDPSSMVINATLNQVDAERVRLGQKARVRFDAYADLVLPAHVESVAAMTKPGMFRAQFVKEVAVRLKIDAMDPRVIPDLSVSVEIVQDSTDAAGPMAPVGAIFRDKDSARAYVFVHSATGWQRRDVEVGMRNYLAAAVKGVKPGEIVALDDPRGPR